MRVVPLVLCGVLGLAQAPAFEAASVKPVPKADSSFMRGGPGTADPGRLMFSNVPLINMLAWGFDLRATQIDGPGWIAEDRYDLNATLPTGSTRAEMREMLRILLTERFHLVTHEATKSMDSYELSIAKGGPKLKESHAGAEPNWPPSFRQLSPGTQNLLLLSGALTMRTRDYLARHGGTMAQLTQSLGSFVLGGPPVFDRTGLTGEYDYYIEFAPPGVDVAATGDDPAPSIFTAFQEQLGLKLEVKKIPTRVVVVDHVERVPERN